MDFNKYTAEMSKSVWDKAFFIDKIEGAKCVIDFGCADGALIRFLANLFPEMTFVGYDMNKELIARATDLCSNKNCLFFNTDENEEMLSWIRDNFSSNEICINFSSVWHELLSSTESESAVNFCRILKPRYITIRDMFFTYDTTLPKVKDSVWDLVISNVETSYRDEFEEKFGSTMEIKNFIHFLLKYQWKDNGWDEEMKENYFALKPSSIPFLAANYREIFKNRYVLPHLRHKFESMGINCDIFRTHIQVVFENI